MSRQTLLLTISMTLILAAPLAAQGVDIPTALQSVPSSANSLAIVKVQDLLNSPRGLKEEWAKRQQSQYMAGAIHIPPTVDFVVRAFEFHPEDSRVTQTYGIAAFQKPVSMSAIAAHEKERIEMINGHPVVHTNRNSYIAELAPGLVGAVYPDYRQNLGRWLRDADRGARSNLTPYLKEVAAHTSESQVVLALDFQDLFDPKTWRERIKTSPALADKPNAIKTMSQLADGLRGLTMRIHVGEKTTAVISLDFNTAVSQTAKPFFLPILTDLLDEAGASLDDLANASVDTNGNSATLTFELSDVGLRHVMSIILMPSVGEPPPPAAEVAGTTDPNAVTTGAQNAGKASLVATRNYYGSIIQILTDLEVLARKGVNYDRTAVWHENYARKIDQLPIRGVDRDMIDWGNKVASQLRALAVSLRGVPIEVRKLQGSVTYNVNYHPGGFYNANGSIWSSVGYLPETLNVETNQSLVRTKQAEAIAAGAKQRQEIWEMLADDRQQIRVKMSEKYGKDFDSPR